MAFKLMLTVPSSVNFKALSIKLIKICVSLVGSPIITVSISCLSISIIKSIFFSFAFKLNPAEMFLTSW